MIAESALRASAALLLVTMLSGCVSLGAEREVGCQGEERAMLMRGGDELAQRVPELVVEYYAGCDSGQSAYVAWEHPSFARLAKQMSSLGCTYIPPTDPGSGAFDCDFSGQVFEIGYTRMADRSARGSVGLPEK